jgi:hypothetical protein
MKFLKNATTRKIFTFMMTALLLFTMIGCKTTEETEPTNDLVPVTSITMQSVGSATTITTHHGTLQLSATVLPVTASNKNVTWSIMQGTGTATISQTGLLSALTDGTVTAKVTSDSVSTLSTELVITISNQVTDNTGPLADAIAIANDNKTHTQVGTSASDFVSSVYWVETTDLTSYQTAITAAEAILAQGALSNTEVSNAVSDLEDATDVFNDAKQPGTKVVMKIDLGLAEDFVILSKTGVSTTGTTAVVGHIGVSPVSASYITGFGLIMDSGNEFSTSSLVTGQIYAADYQIDTPTYLTTAIANMQTAYTDGAARTADYTELYTGDLSGKTLTTGVYMWSNDVLINTDLTLNGTASDVMIFQIAGTLTMASNTHITLTGGLQAENIYWIVANTVAIGTNSSFQGIVLSMTNVSMGTGSSMVGMIYAQTDVSLDATVLTKA